MLKLLKKHKTTHPADAPGRLFSDLAEQSADVARPVKASGDFLEIDGDRMGKCYEMVVNQLIDKLQVLRDKLTGGM